MLKNVCIIITFSFSYKELFANSCSLEKTITQTITCSILYCYIWTSLPIPHFIPPQLIVALWETSLNYVSLLSVLPNKCDLSYVVVT